MLNHFKEEDLLGNQDVAKSFSTSATMVETEDQDITVNTDTANKNYECLHMMALPLSPVDLGTPGALSNTKPALPSDPDKRKEETLKLESALRCSFNETTSEQTKSSSSVQPTPTKTTDMLDPARMSEPVKSVRNTHVNLHTYHVLQTEKSLETRTNVRSKPTEVVIAKAKMHEEKSKTEHSVTNVFPTQAKSIEDSITTVIDSPRNWTTVTMETNTGSTLVNKVPYQEKKTEVTGTRGPTAMRQKHPVAISQQALFHQPEDPRTEQEQVSSALSEREQKMHTDGSPEVRREEPKHESVPDPKTDRSGESESYCYSDDTAACPEKPTTLSGKKNILVVLYLFIYTKKENDKFCLFVPV